MEYVPSGEALSIVAAPHVAKSNTLPVGRWPGPPTGALCAHQLEDGWTHTCRVPTTDAASRALTTCVFARAQVDLTGC